MQYRASPFSYDIAALVTLARFGWVLTEHLHQLCFPDRLVSTVRSHLTGFQNAGWVSKLRWRSGELGRGQGWAITPRGLDAAANYGPVDPICIPQNTGRPCTPLEHIEWRVQIHLRDVITRLVQGARDEALLATLSI